LQHELRATYASLVRLLGVDVGERRIGLAITDPSGTLARPFATLNRSRSDGSVTELSHRIEALRLEPDGLSMVVVGLPKRLDGTPTEYTAAVQAFASALASEIALPVVFQDERLTSIEAEQRLALREGDWKKRKKVLDAAAAAIILQDYIDERARLH
jgi:putative Holliday junction resolvase